MKKNGFILYFFVLMLLFYGCASTGFLMAKAKVSLFGNVYPAKEENETIDVYITSKPNQEYLEFAQIICKDTDDKWSMQQILKKAREIGADGIIVVGKTGSYGVGNSTFILSEEYGITAVAIKYKSLN